MSISGNGSNPFAGYYHACTDRRSTLRAPASASPFVITPADRADADARCACLLCCSIRHLPHAPAMSEQVDGVHATGADAAAAADAPGAAGVITTSRRMNRRNRQHQPSQQRRTIHRMVQKSLSHQQPPPPLVARRLPRCHSRLLLRSLARSLVAARPPVACSTARMTWTSSS